MIRRHLVSLPRVRIYYRTMKRSCRKHATDGNRQRCVTVVSQKTQQENRRSLGGNRCLMLHNVCCCLPMTTINSFLRINTSYTNIASRALVRHTLYIIFGAWLPIDGPISTIGYFAKLWANYRDRYMHLTKLHGVMNHPWLNYREWIMVAKESHAIMTWWIKQEAWYVMASAEIYN